MTEALAHTHPPASQLVPAGYAEKAMASLMQLHSELMDEKERRVDLFRKLMEREQALAELRMYVKLLEEKAGLATPAPAPPPPPSPPRAQPAVTLRPPVPPQVNGARRPEGWKAW